MGNVVGADKIAWVHIENRRLLVARNEGAQRFYLPGGAREPGETDVQALAREVEEELAVRIDPTTARHIGTYVAQRDNSQDDLIFIAYSADHDGGPVASMEVAELAWITRSEGHLVTDAARQLMQTLVQRDVLD